MNSELIRMKLRCNGDNIPKWSWVRIAIKNITSLKIKCYPNQSNEYVITSKNYNNNEITIPTSKEYFNKIKCIIENMDTKIDDPLYGLEV